MKHPAKTKKTGKNEIGNAEWIEMIPRLKAQRQMLPLSQLQQGNKKGAHKYCIPAVFLHLSRLKASGWLLGCLAPSAVGKHSVCARHHGAGRKLEHHTSHHDFDHLSCM